MPLTSDAVERVMSLLIINGEKLKRSSAGWMARCPAHEDSTASLSIREGRDGRALLYCHAGCDLVAIVGALGLHLGDLFPDKVGDFRPTTRWRQFPPPPRVRAIKRPVEYVEQRLVKTYLYRHEDGRPNYEVLRYEPKSFRQRHYSPSGELVWGLEGVERTVYRLPELVVAIDKGHTIFVVEGEKDVDRLWDEGYAATCNSGGAMSWPKDPQINGRFYGAHVVLIPDNDVKKDGKVPVGEKHMLDVEQKLSPYTGGLVILRLPPEYKDVSEFLDDGGRIVVSTGEDSEHPEEVVRRVSDSNV